MGQHPTAAMLAVMNATTPLFAALLAHVPQVERVGRWRMLGRVGTVGAISVTFLNPVVAGVSGALYLGEVVTLQRDWPACIGRR